MTYHLTATTVSAWPPWRTVSMPMLGTYKFKFDNLYIRYKILYDLSINKTVCIWHIDTIVLGEVLLRGNATKENIKQLETNDMLNITNKY